MTEQEQLCPKMRTLGLGPVHGASGEKVLLLFLHTKGGWARKGRHQAATEDSGHSSWATLEQVTSYNASFPTGVPLSVQVVLLGGPTLPWPTGTLVYHYRSVPHPGLVLLAVLMPQADLTTAYQAGLLFWISKWSTRLSSFAPRLER